jgi:hypothetical protein
LTGKAPLITRDVLDDVGGGVPLFDCRKARDRLGLAPRSAEEAIVDTLRWALFMGWLPEGLASAIRGKNPPEPAWGTPSA